MLEVRHLMDGEPVNPANHKELTIELNFDADSPDARVTTNRWRFVNKDAQRFLDLTDGFNGGTGLTEGVPYDIVLNYNNESIVLKQLLKGNDEETTLSCEEVEVSAIDRAGIEWLNGRADGFTFQYLNEETSFLPSSLNKSIPYVINSVPNYRDAFVTSLSATIMFLELKKLFFDIQGTISAMGNPFQSAGEALKLIFKVAYGVVLLIGIFKLIKDLIDYIVQPVKYHAAMYVLDQINAACSFLGLKFSSTILQSEPYNRMCIMPRKLKNPIANIDNDGENPLSKNNLKNKIFGFLKPDNSKQHGYFDGTFGDLLRTLKDAFNAKVIVKDGILYFERVDFKISSAQYIVPDIYAPTYKTNANELISNYVIEFLTDNEDRNTVQEYDGTIYQVITQPIVIKDKKNVLLKGFINKSIPLSLAKTKVSLTVPEEIIRDILAVVDTVYKVICSIVDAILSVARAAIGILNAVIEAINFLLPEENELKKIPSESIKGLPSKNFTDVIEDRIGMLMLESDIVDVPKVFILKEGSTARKNKIDVNNGLVLSAQYLWDNYHFVNSFVPSATKPNGNQYIRKSIKNVPFTFNDYKLVRDNAQVFSPDGKEAKIETLRWNPWDQLAEIDYRVNEKWTSNLKISTHNGNGF